MFKNLRLNQEAVDSFAAYPATYLAADISNGPHFATAIREDLSDLDRLASADVCERRRQKLGLSHDPQTLRERIIDVDGQIAIAGIRFKNLDLARPFVSLTANFEISKKHISKLQPKIQEEFPHFKPLGFSFRQAPGSISGILEWDHVLFGKCQIDAFPLPAIIQVSWPKVFLDYPTYHSEYSKRLSDKPSLRGHVRIEDEETLQEAARANMLLVIHDELGFAGLVAGKNEGLYGLPCVYIFEMLLAERWIGRKLAPIVQSHFIDHKKKQFSHVWGQIYSQNLPSLKNAQRVGRKIIQTEYFCPLEQSAFSRKNEHS